MKGRFFTAKSGRQCINFLRKKNFKNVGHFSDGLLFGQGKYRAAAVFKRASVAGKPLGNLGDYLIHSNDHGAVINNSSRIAVSFF